MEFKLAGRPLYPHGFAINKGGIPVTDGEMNRLICLAVQSLKESGDSYTYFMTGDTLVMACVDDIEGIVIFATRNYAIGWCDE